MCNLVYFTIRFTGPPELGGPVNRIVKYTTVKYTIVKYTIVKYTTGPLGGKGLGSVNRESRFTEPKPFPPRGPVNRGLTVPCEYDAKLENIIHRGPD